MSGTAKGKTVRLSRETDLLKLVAIMAMLIDHLGAALFPQAIEMRIIGRIAFPLFCYTLAAGCCFTRSMGKYALRLLLAALISQPFYAIGLNHQTLAMRQITFANPVVDALRWYGLSFSTCNIMVTLLLGQLTIWTIKERKFALTGLLCFFILWLDSTGWITSSYGAKGIMLMVLFYLFIDKPVASFVWVFCFMAQWALRTGGYQLFGVRVGIQAWAMLALPLIYLPVQRHVKLPKALFYLFYPAHLGLIILLKALG